MHTVKIIAAGVALLVVCLLVGRAMGPTATAGMIRGAKVFLPLWAIGAAINMYIGVSRAGYSVADEAPILLVVFGVPAAVAGILMWWFARS